MRTHVSYNLNKSWPKERVTLRMVDESELTITWWIELRKAGTARGIWSLQKPWIGGIWPDTTSATYPSRAVDAAINCPASPFHDVLTAQLWLSEHRSYCEAMVEAVAAHVGTWENAGDGTRLRSRLMRRQRVSSLNMLIFKTQRELTG